MSRWSWLTAFCFAPWIVGCAPSLQPGLANAPRLGGTQLADERVSDAVSNGGDSCGRNADPGPLRGRWPPCPTTHSMAGAAFAPSSAPSGSFVVPWLEHFYSGWPCARGSMANVASSGHTPPWVTTAPPTPVCTLP
jgi:hypothetical protein